MTLAAFPVATTAVVNKPVLPDSLMSPARQQIPGDDSDFGAGTIFMMGNILLSQGDAVGAIPYLSQAYSMSPDEVEIAEAYRDVLLELSYRQDALDVSTHLLRTAGDKFETHRTHVLILAIMEKYDDALTHLGGFQADYPDSTTLHLLEGEILLRASRLSAAFGKYEQLREMFPEDGERHTLMLMDIAAVIHTTEKQTALWRRYTDEMPESKGLTMGFLRFLVNNGQDRDAIDWARQAAERQGTDEANGMSWVTLATGMIAEAGRINTAIELLETQHGEHGLSLEATSMLARFYVRRGDLQAARDKLQEAVRSWPDEVDNHLLLGEILTELGEYEAGMEQFIIVESLDPSNTESYFARISLLSRQYPAIMDPGPHDTVTNDIIATINKLSDRAESYLSEVDYGGFMILGSVKMALGNLEDAAVHYEKAAADADNHHDALLNLSLVYAELMDFDAAIKVLDLLYEEYPEDPVVQNAFGYTLADADRDLEKARILVGKALASDADNPAYLDSMGWVQYRLGDYAKALDFLIKATNALPEDPVILEHMARTLLKMNRPDKALLVVDRAIEAGGKADVLTDLKRDIENAKTVDQP
jgi:tetratricopeptide (TPR) repeat protein